MGEMGPGRRGREGEGGFGGDLDLRLLAFLARHSGVDGLFLLVVYDFVIGVYP